MFVNLISVLDKLREKLGQGDSADTSQSWSKVLENKAIIKIATNNVLPNINIHLKSETIL